MLDIRIEVNQNGNIYTPTNLKWIEYIVTLQCHTYSDTQMLCFRITDCKCALSKIWELYMLAKKWF